MKCPKLKNMRPIAAGWEEAFFGDCLQEECAWWDERHGCCGERTKRLQLERIADFLKDIAELVYNSWEMRRK